MASMFNMSSLFFYFHSLLLVLQVYRLKDFRLCVVALDLGNLQLIAGVTRQCCQGTFVGSKLQKFVIGYLNNRTPYVYTTYVCKFLQHNNGKRSVLLFA